MKLVFDHSIDGGGWPGPLGLSDAVCGEAWLGPAGLLDLLETQLGLGARRERPLQRATRLAARLVDREGFWRPAFDVDPVGTAVRLLRDRDFLRMWGWAGQGISSRLTELHAATEEASAGIADRLWVVARAVCERGVDIERIISYTRFELLPPAWREVFAQLRLRGVTVEEVRPDAAKALGDLALARGPSFEPTGDGRLCLFRRYGVLDTADEVAASLAAFDSLDGVVVVGADEVLDRALARLGLPRSDADESAPASVRLLTLVIEAAFEPVEMTDLHALLVADPGPVPRGIARELVRGLNEYPGRRSKAWSEALATGLAALEADRREVVEKRVRGLLVPACKQEEPLPMTELRARLNVLSAWARARLGGDPSLSALVQSSDALLEDADALGKPGLTRHELRRLQEGFGEPSFQWRFAQAGLAHTRDAGALLAAARAVVWWNFTRSSAPRANGLWLTVAEREGLRSAGVEAPVPAMAMELEAEAWRRPLLLAREALVLVCPLTDGAGETEHPHPLWDEVTASLKDPRSLVRLERDRIEYLAPALLVGVPSRALVRAAPVVTIPRALALRSVESPSSLERLIGCSLSWAFAYEAKVHDGFSAPLPPPGPLTWGKIAHGILAQVLPREPTNEDRAGALALELFDSQALELCEELGLPQWQAERASLRRTIEEAARALARLASKHGVNNVRTEAESKVGAIGLEIAGRLDVVWDTPRVVIDLKWGKSTYQKLLETGTAVQLATYAAMQGGAGVVETAYYSLLTRDLLTEPRGRLRADGYAPGAVDNQTTWTATKGTLEARRLELAAGLLQAPGAAPDPPEPALLGAVLQLAPPCRYCSYGGLCGRGGEK